jgi:hypothetical protein
METTISPSRKRHDPLTGDRVVDRLRGGDGGLDAGVTGGIRPGRVFWVAAVARVCGSRSDRQR